MLNLLKFINKLTIALGWIEFKKTMGLRVWVLLEQTRDHKSNR